MKSASLKIWNCGFTLAYMHYTPERTNDSRKNSSSDIHLFLNQTHVGEIQASQADYETANFKSQTTKNYNSSNDKK